jgi:hypothetical protein
MYFKFAKQLLAYNGLADSNIMYYYVIHTLREIFLERIVCKS